MRLLARESDYIRYLHKLTSRLLAKESVYIGYLHGLSSRLPSKESVYIGYQVGYEQMIFFIGYQVGFKQMNQISQQVASKCFLNYRQQVRLQTKASRFVEV